MTLSLRAITLIFKPCQTKSLSDGALLFTGIAFKPSSVVSIPVPSSAQPFDLITSNQRWVSTLGTIK